MEENPTGHAIVVGVDGSVPSKQALDWAAREALRRRVPLEVVHAWTVPPSFYADDGLSRRAPFEAAARAVLDDAVGSLAAFDLVPADVRPTLVDGDAAPALLEAAAAGDLLVVGSRGHGGFLGLLLGSVSQRCVFHAPCPVAIVPSTWMAGSSRRVVVGVDGSDASYGVLRWAVAEAERRNARLDVVNAYDYHAFVSPFGLVLENGRDQLERSSQSLLEGMVAAVLGRAGARRRPVELIPSPSNAARALLDVAAGADLLVIGSRGRGTVRGFRFGSVSQQCVHHAPCPVVVVPPRWELRPGSEP